MSSFNPGRFASPFRTETFVFGHREPLTAAERRAGDDPRKKPWIPDPCSCPGAPHEQDTADVLVKVSPSAKARIGRAELEGAVRLDPLAAHRQMVVEGVVRWNLLWPDPNAKDPETAEAVPVPVNAATAELLDDLVALAEWIDELWSETDPNSAAPSRVSRRGSGSRPPRKTPTRGT